MRRGMRPYEPLTEEQKEWLREHGDRLWDEVCDGFYARFGIILKRSRLKNIRKRLGIACSVKDAGQFRKGNVPANKGRKLVEFMTSESLERFRATQFKKGNVPHNAKGKGIGYERVTKDGYVEVKVRDGLQERPKENFRFKHHLVWEEANGRPLPEGHMVIFTDHDKRNFDPENLVAVPRSLWAFICRQGAPYWDRESFMACVAAAKLKEAIGKANMRPRPCRRCGGEFRPRYGNQRTCDRCLGREA